MKIYIECDVESKTRIVIDGQSNERIDLEYDDKVYTFRMNTKGYLSKVGITAKVDRPEMYFSRQERQNQRPAFIFGTDSEFDQAIIAEFQLLEGLLALLTNGSVRNIKWGLPKFKYLPETEEEKQRTRLPTFSAERRELELEAKLSIKDLERVLITKKRYTPLNIYLSIYREGLNEYAARRFIYAFYNFFYILEGMFSGGNPKKLKSDFEHSKDLVSSIDGLLKHNSTDRPENQEKLLKVLKHRGLNDDRDGLITLLVRSRGDLHHFQNNANRIQPNTFNQDEFEVIAFITFYLAEASIKQRINLLNEEFKRQKGISTGK